MDADDEGFVAPRQSCILKQAGAKKMTTEKDGKDDSDRLSHDIWQLTLKERSKNEEGRHTCVPEV